MDVDELLDDLVLEIEVETAQNDAAVKIQAAHRGRAARAEMRAREQAAVRIQAVTRGRSIRKEAAQQQHAATKIQALHRGRAARKDADARRRDASSGLGGSDAFDGEVDAVVDDIVEAATVDQSVDEDEVDELANTLVDTAAADAERHAAAVKIQAIHRGGVGRRIASNVKRANDDESMGKHSDDDEAAAADPVRRAEMELERLMSPDLEPLPEPESSVDELTGELHQTSRSALEEATRFAEDLANEA